MGRRKSRRFPITTVKAQAMVLEMYGIKVTLPTIITWVKKNNLGNQIGGKGRWWIDEEKFAQYIKNGKITDD